MMDSTALLCVSGNDHSIPRLRRMASSSASSSFSAAEILGAALLELEAGLEELEGELRTGAVAGVFGASTVRELVTGVVLREAF